MKNICPPHFSISVQVVVLACVFLVQLVSGASRSLALLGQLVATPPGIRWDAGLHAVDNLPQASTIPGCPPPPHAAAGLPHCHPHPPPLLPVEQGQLEETEQKKHSI